MGLVYSAGEVDDGAAGAVVPRHYVALKIATDQGIEGIGVACFGGALTRALQVALEDPGGVIAGLDPTQPERIAAKTNRGGGRAGGGGAGRGGWWGGGRSA